MPPEDHISSKADMGVNRSLQVLPILGALPFIFGALALTFGMNSLPVIGSTQTFTASYGLAILSFMSGVLWGQAIAGMADIKALLIASNIVTLSAWFGYLLLNTAGFALLLIALFSILLFVDYRLAANGLLDRSYVRTRTVVTTLVNLSLAAVLIAVF
jgi:hypothetical protein